MAMHIRSAKAHELVREIAERTGQTQEGAVLAAAEFYLRSLRQTSRAQEILDEGVALGRLVGLECGADPTADLYDDNGLPA